MKLFIREHLLLIVMQAVQAVFIPFLFWLDGFRGTGVMFYAIFLSFVFLTVYLVYKYVSRRHFYRRLEHHPETLEDALEPTGNAPISASLDGLLRSQYRLYQEKLHQAKTRQEEHLLFIDRWVHQMKTPLSVIELTAQNLDEPQSSSIREETERMKHGLNMVLHMARLRSVAEDFRVKPVLLSKLVQEVNRENKRFYIRNEVFPRVREERPGITVASDEKWLYFILSQLVHNAVKYSSGKAKHLVISIYERSGEAVLEVKDFGIGIPAADRKRVFQKFFTGEIGRKYRESTGMGLYLAKEAADRLEHRLELESETGKGTTVRIIFPKTQNLTRM